MKTIDITKEQVKKINKDFNRCVSNFSDMGISDYEYSDDTVRVFVDFEFCLREVDIKSIEILDDDYETIHSENTLSLRKCIEEVIENYNQEQNYLDRNFDSSLAEERDYRNHIMFGLYY